MPTAKAPTVSTIKCGTFRVKLVSRVFRQNNGVACPVQPLKKVPHIPEESEGDHAV